MLGIAITQGLLADWQQGTELDGSVYRVAANIPVSTLVLTFRDADNFAQEDLSQMRLGMLVLILTYSVLCFLSAKYGRRAPDHSRCTPTRILTQLVLSPY